VRIFGGSVLEGIGPCLVWLRRACLCVCGRPRSVSSDLQGWEDRIWSFLRARWELLFCICLHPYSCSRFTPAESLVTSVLIRGSEFGSRSSLAVNRTPSPPLPSTWRRGGGLNDEFSSCSGWAGSNARDFEGEGDAEELDPARALLRLGVEDWVVSPAEERSEPPSGLVVNYFSFAIYGPLINMSRRIGGGKGG